MLKLFPVLKIVLSFIIPYFILYALYIQLNGEVSPGGGFQAGVIFAAAIIALDLTHGKERTLLTFSEQGLIICAVTGVLIYAATGLISFLFNDNYLNYSSIAKNPIITDPIAGQHIGIFSIEIGVGLTVASIMCLIYSGLRED